MPLRPLDWRQRHLTDAGGGTFGAPRTPTRRRPLVPVNSVGQYRDGHYCWSANRLSSVLTLPAVTPQTTRTWLPRRPAARALLASAPRLLGRRLEFSGYRRPLASGDGYCVRLPEWSVFLSGANISYRAASPTLLHHALWYATGTALTQLKAGLGCFQSAHSDQAPSPTAVPFTQ